MIGGVEPSDRLLRAVERGLLPSLVEFGFTIGVAESANRGASVDLVGGERRIEVHADWLEGEVVVVLLDPDQPAQTVVRLTRLARNLGVSVLEARLRRVAPLVVATIL